MTTKVTRVALENTASISEIFITTECMITEVMSAEPAMSMEGVSYQYILKPLRKTERFF